MVENFTTIEEKTYTSDLKEAVVPMESEFEAKIRHCIQKFTKEPRQSVIDGLLEYSRSLHQGEN